MALQTTAAEDCLCKIRARLSEARPLSRLPRSPCAGRRGLWDRQALGDSQGGEVLTVADGSVASSPGPLPGSQSAANGAMLNLHRGTRAAVAAASTGCPRRLYMD